MSYAAENQGFESTEMGQKRPNGPTIQEVMKANIELISQVKDGFDNLKGRLAPVIRPVPTMAEKSMDRDGSPEASLLNELQSHHHLLRELLEEIREVTRGLVL